MKWGRDVSNEEHCLKRSLIRADEKIKEGNKFSAFCSWVGIGKLWYSRIGLYDLLTGCTAGRFLLYPWYEWVSIQRQVAQAEKLGKVREGAGGGANQEMILIHALLMFGRWKEAHLVARRLYEHNHPEEWWGLQNNTPFQGFTLKLIAVLAGEAPSVTPEQAKRFSLGVYQGMFDAWDDLGALRFAIEKALDWHQREQEKAYNELESLPINIIPMEILAFVRVREKFGLETILPKHDLLDNPMVQNMPRDLPVIEDEILRKAVAIAQEEYPEIEYPNDNGSQNFEWVIDFDKRIPFGVPKVKKVDFMEVLLTGTEEQIESALGDGDLALVVDWGMSGEEVLADVERLVPGFEWSAGEDLEMNFNGRTQKVTCDLEGEHGVFPLLPEVVKILEPEWELRVFTPSQDDDTVVYLAQPAEFWHDTDKRANAQSRRMFGRVSYGE